jgi:ABC-type lipoprotein release transport system permease subunit
VSQRRHAFAIRIAVGANRRTLVWLVVGDGLRNAVVAIATGVVLVAAASPFIADLLFDVSPCDPRIFAVAAGGVLLVATGASLLPAWRASTIHPTETLRIE